MGVWAKVAQCLPTHMQLLQTGNYMAWYKTDVSDFFGWNFFLQYLNFLHVLFNFVVKHSLVFLAGMHNKRNEIGFFALLFQEKKFTQKIQLICQSYIKPFNYRYIPFPFLTISSLGPIIMELPYTLHQLQHRLSSWYVLSWKNPDLPLIGRHFWPEHPQGIEIWTVIDLF